MTWSESYSSSNRRNLAGRLHIPPKLPYIFLVCAALWLGVHIYAKRPRPIAHTSRNSSRSLVRQILRDIFNLRNNAADTEKGSELEDTFDYAQYADLDVYDAIAALRKWKLRALNAEATNEARHVDEQSTCTSEASKLRRNLLNRTLISTLNNFILETWLREKDSMTRWLSTVDIINNFWDAFFKELNVMPINNHDETKYFADFISTPLSCSIVTLGVGQDTIVESKFLKRYPQCLFVAADPKAEVNQGLVEKLNGSFVHAAVAGTSGVFSAGIYGVKGPVTMDHIGLGEFLREYNVNEVVDWLNIDVEKSELGILQAMHDNSTRIPPVCQFNVEVHYAPDYNLDYYNQFIPLLQKIILKGHYLLLHAELPNPKIISRRFKFLRLYFLNIRDAECTRKFIC